MFTDKSFHFSQGNGPLLISMPHIGVEIPTEIAPQLTDEALKSTDTDWYVDRLYNFTDDLDCSVIKARYSRYAIDLNRGAGGKALYPGQSETELCPTRSFDDESLYRGGAHPDQAEVDRRKTQYWQPYHDKLRNELERIKARYGYALLWDAHSIQSRVPRFFDGRLPDLNLGTGDGISCPDLAAQKLLFIAQASHYEAVLNGRFKGGYITRNYGDPANHIYAVQLEISQITYMDEAPTFRFQDARAEQLRPILRAMIAAFCASFEGLDQNSG